MRMLMVPDGTAVAAIRDSPGPATIRPFLTPFMDAINVVRDVQGPAGTQFAIAAACVELRGLHGHVAHRAAEHGVAPVIRCTRTG